MAITLADQATNGNIEFDNSQSATLGGTPTDGDIIVMLETFTDTSLPSRTWPSGFTEFIASVSSGGFHSSLVGAWKRAASESGATYTLTLGASVNNAQLSVSTWRGCLASGSPIDVLGSAHENSFATTTVSPAITIVTANAVHIIPVCQSDNLPGALSATGYSASTNAGSNPRIAFVYKIGVGAGSTGAITVSGLANGDAAKDVAFALAPAAAGGVTVTPGTLALVLTRFAPTVATPRLVTPGTKALALTTFAPRVIADTKVTPGTRALTITAFAPTVATPRLVTPGKLGLVITGFAPTVSAGSGTPAGGSASSHRRRTAQSRGNIQVQHRQSEHGLSLDVLSATASLSVTLGRTTESPEQRPRLRVPQPPGASPTPRRANPPLRITAPMASATASLSLSVGYVPFYVTLLERKDEDLAALQAKMDESSSTRKSLQSRIDALMDEVIELEDKLLLGV